MSMLIPGLNQLADPEIVKIIPFEQYFAEFKADVLAHVQSRDPQKAARLTEALENDSELLTMAMQAMTLRLQTHERKYNARIKQMLAWWAEGTNLDARLSDMGLERRMIDAGDPSAYPPIPATYESDGDARQRYYLAPHAPAAGSRLHYRREAMTLGERAQVAIERNATGELVVTYTFSPDGFAAQVKDANGRRIAPGEVVVTVLGRSGDGAPGADLLAAARAHFARDDVRPETDLVTVRGAEIVPYKIRATVFINPGPDAQLTKTAAEAALATYAESCHRLGGYIDRSRIDYVLHSAGAERLQLQEPLASIDCEAHQAPYCTEILIEVATL